MLASSALADCSAAFPIYILLLGLRWLPPFPPPPPRSPLQDNLRVLASSALADCSAAFPADILLLGLSRSLEACKLPRTRLTVLEYACQHIGHGEKVVMRHHHSPLNRLQGVLLCCPTLCRCQVSCQCVLVSSAP